MSETVENMTFGPDNLPKANMEKTFVNCTFTGVLKSHIFHKCRFENCAFVEGRIVDTTMNEVEIVASVFKSFRIRNTVFPIDGGYIFADAQTEKAFTTHFRLRGKPRGGRKVVVEADAEVEVDLSDILGEVENG